MSFEKRPDGRFDHIQPEGIEISTLSIVPAGDELLPLCAMCIKSPMHCENTFIRDIEIPVPPGDPDEVIGYGRNEDGTYSEKQF